MDRKENRYYKIYPWYSGLTGDLLFYIAIDSLFLTIVKHFTAAQIVSLTSLSQLICIALQFPVLFVIKKIGNTASVRVGALLLLLSAVLTTLGSTYYVMLLGRVLHDAAAIFRSASVVALENNLETDGKRSEFVRIRTKANTVYSVLTMLIAFVASYLFNLNHYLPMIGCITTCTVGFVLSLMMKDSSGNDKVVGKKSAPVKGKMDYGKFIVIAMLCYAVFYATVASGQRDGKLFIQQHVLLDFDVEKTALIIGAIVCASRILRVLSNMVFAKLYEKHQEKTGLFLTILLSCAVGALLFGSMIPQVLVKILVMATGFAALLFARDPFNLYTQDVLLAYSPKEQHQTLLTTMSFGVKVLSAGMGLVFSAILVGHPMMVVIAILLAVSTVEIVLAAVLYRMVVRRRKLLAQ